MKIVWSVFVFLAVCPVFAERYPYERYQPIVDRQMFGRPPIGFDPTRPPGEVSRSEQQQLTKEQEQLKSSIQFSMINITPDGEIAVGFTDNGDPTAKGPVHYYLKVGEKRNGWEVIKADPVEETMTIAKGDLVVPMKLGANSAGAGAPRPASAASGGARPAALSVRDAAGTNRLNLPGSLRERRRVAKEQQRVQQERQTAQAVMEALKVEEQKREQEKEQEKERHLQELESIKNELKAQAEEVARQRAASAKAEETKDKDASDAGDES